MARVFWFRRDLRLQDNIALNAAIAAAKADGDSKVCGLYPVNTDTLYALSGIRQHSLIASLDALGASMDGKLVIRHGDVAESVVAAALAAEASTVQATRSFDPAGVTEQNQVGLALKAAGVHLQLDDSYYAVAPGTVAKPDGTALCGPTVDDGDAIDNRFSGLT